MPASRRAALLLLGFFFVSAACVAGQAAPANSANDSLKNFLRQYLAALPGAPATPDKTVQFAFARALLGGAKEDLVVYISGRQWCGSGGCILLILEPDGAGSYSVIGRATLVRPPVRMLPGVTSGYHDLGVWVQGGGVRPGYEATLPFSGGRYAGNPTLAPAHRNFAAAGDLLIPANPSSEPLFE